MLSLNFVRRYIDVILTYLKVSEEGKGRAMLPLGEVLELPAKRSVGWF